MEKTFPMSKVAFEQVAIKDLSVGSVYYIAQFLDARMFVCEVSPVVFVGQNLDRQGDERLFFQDFESHAGGVRYESQSGEATFTVFDATEATGVYHLAVVIEVLTNSLRRIQGAS